MPVSVNHHVGLRVSDIERSTRFYIEAFGGHRQTSPMLREGPGAEMIMGGVPGTRFLVCHIGFDDGTIELFQFLAPVNATGGVPDAEAALMHFAFSVDDVPATLAKVEAAGGQRYWPQVNERTGFQVVYVTDPDGNVIEIVDIGINELIGRLIAENPANAPAGES
jgi:glyoxylase I family protein